ncbi:hypothetical protein [Bradyrhizobium oligotrophicum]|uniref:hypothetical protein n=1 Tax=Bradyrhizobium oligotrophicum TaxID=44255 RepID=UPI00034D4751|nr:hypothetical protein [Bradyrhizobium oligotrophicum]
MKTRDRVVDTEKFSLLCAAVSIRTSPRGATKQDRHRYFSGVLDTRFARHHHPVHRINADARVLVGEGNEAS